MLVSAGLGRTGLVLIWEGDSWQPGQRDNVDDAFTDVRAEGEGRRDRSFLVFLLYLFPHGTWLKLHSVKELPAEFCPAPKV